MLAENEILEALKAVIDPELGKNIVELGMVRQIQIDPKGRVRFDLVLTVLGCPMREQMSSNARKALMALPGVTEVTIDFRAMSEEERKAIFGQTGQTMLPKLTQFNRIGQVLTVMSGKGGVGKSSVTAMLAVALARSGKKVGILDADITGPSIPKLFGLPPGGLRGSDQGMLPAIGAHGIRIVSTNLLVAEEDMPVVWRGPMITSTIRQFWADTLWGKLDYLLVDLPPGTSDATISVMTMLPLNGAVMVTTPQQLSAMVVRKAVRMLNNLKVPILGVVENMSYYRCPETGKEHAVFGPSHVEEIAAASGAALWARLPIDPQVTQLCDAGRVGETNLPEMEQLVRLLAQ